MSQASSYSKHHKGSFSSECELPEWHHLTDSHFLMQRAPALTPGISKIPDGVADLGIGVIVSQTFGSTDLLKGFDLVVYLLSLLQPKYVSGCRSLPSNNLFIRALCPSHF